MWSGVPTALPVGWALCDGQGGRPDLRGRFVVGYDVSSLVYNVVGNNGGTSSFIVQPQNLPVTCPWSLNDPGHQHSYTDRYVVSTSLSTGNSSNNKLNYEIWETKLTTESTTGITFGNNTAGGGQPIDNRPPYFVIAYIIKTTY
ncbi:MAG: hypothetical protein U0U66_14760 [Cytophagaceae bacterium]